MSDSTSVADVPAHPAQWAELVTTALLGTERRSIDELSGTDGPTVLLRRAARHRVLDRLTTPATAPAGPDVSVADRTAPAQTPAAQGQPAPAQDRPEAPPAADRLLEDLLRTPDSALVSCWLTACARHGRTVAAVHWTRLARLAARTTAYERWALGDALGPQGRWFLRQNPDWRKLAADVEVPAEPEPAPEPVPSPAPPAALTATDVLADPACLFAAARPWGTELVSAAYAVLGGEGQVPPPRGFATRLGIALPSDLYSSIAQAGEFYVLNPDASPARRRTIRDRFVALELAAYARAAIDHAFSERGDDTGFPRAEIPMSDLSLDPTTAPAAELGVPDRLRPHAEEEYAGELAALEAADDKPKPPQWRLSPWAVVTYLMGGVLPDGTEISAKYIGARRLMEVAVATLATDRALLLLGVPGTAKSWVSEHLAAAISGRSTLLVQGTSGTPEEAIRYGWNYAKLLAEGPSTGALVPSPVMTAMETGRLARIEELTRIPSDVQDALITVLSEKTLPIPELGREVQAIKGFNVIATANDRDRGVNELSSALRRRFNTVVLPLPAELEDEVRIVSTRVTELSATLELPEVPAAEDEIRRVVQVFRELRSGVTADGRTAVKSPTSTLSAAEAISVMTSGLALAAHFGSGTLQPADVAAGLVGAVIKDPVSDRVAWTEYLEVVARNRPGWAEFYRACREVS